MLRNRYFYHFLKIQFFKIRHLFVSDKKIAKKKFYRNHGYYPNLENPRTLNEKILWLKLYSHEDFHTIVADKYAARKWLSDRFGDQYLVPLLFKTDDYKQITIDNMPNEPFVLKSNSGSASFYLIRDKNDYDWHQISKQCKLWLKDNYYYRSQEWQYKNIKPCILAEKMLLDKNGRIPNDYKLHFINGELAFVYCSIDREGLNYRKIYSPDWEPLNFTWLNPKEKNKNGPDIEKPKTFGKMLEIGKEIAKLFPYIRVDFYDVDGKLYYGEITLHHGSGLDVFEPKNYDLFYGKQLSLRK